jgi:hypothetical protein
MADTTHASKPTGVLWPPAKPDAAGAEEELEQPARKRVQFTPPPPASPPESAPSSFESATSTTPAKLRTSPAAFSAVKRSPRRSASEKRKLQAELDDEMIVLEAAVVPSSEDV